MPKAVQAGMVSKKQLFFSVSFSFFFLLCYDVSYLVSVSYLMTVLFLFQFPPLTFLFCFAKLSLQKHHFKFQTKCKCEIFDWLDAPSFMLKYPQRCHGEKKIHGRS
jgi:hypothetical protein